MSTLDQMNQDLKAAMKSGDEVTKNTIRWMKSALQNAEIAQGKALDESAVNDVLAKMAKQYRDSIEQYQTHGRQDLADKEEGELAVLLRYLPDQMSEGEIRALVNNVVNELGAAGPQDKGKVMGKLMPLVKGKADGAVVNRVVSETLAAQ